MAAQGKELDLLQQACLLCRVSLSSPLNRKRKISPSVRFCSWLNHSQRRVKDPFPTSVPKVEISWKRQQRALRESCTYRFFRLYAQCPQILAFLEISSVSLPFPPVGFPYLKRPTQPFNLWNITVLNQLLYHKDESK